MLERRVVNQRQMAAELEVSQSTLSRILSSKQRPSQSLINAFAFYTRRRERSWRWQQRFEEIVSDRIGDFQATLASIVIRLEELLKETEQLQYAVRQQVTVTVERSGDGRVVLRVLPLDNLKGGEPE